MRKLKTLYLAISLKCGHILLPGGRTFYGNVGAERGVPDYQDDEGRLTHRPLAEHVVSRITGKPAFVTDFQDKTENEIAPLPFSLSALQIEAAKRYGLSAQAVLDICQRLYETHKLITYPRSDSRHLPEEHFAGVTVCSMRFLCIPASAAAG